MNTRTTGLSGLEIGLLLSLMAGCGSSDSGSNLALPEPDLEQAIRNTLETLDTDADFTLIAEASTGKHFEHNRGNSKPTTTYRSASSSKLVTAAVILWLVDQGHMALDDHPQDYINFWPDSGNHAAIKLRHLLSFTSGLNNAPLCINLPSANFENCVETILNTNVSISAPGDEYYYESTHMQVAGLMAIEATGLADWTSVFEYFKTNTQLFSQANYDLPSLNNPRLAGGMHWQAREYMAFLRELYHQRLLSPELTMEMRQDQTRTAITAFSPASNWEQAANWRYGYGQWIECPATDSDCNSTGRSSSSGAYGAYPFLDFEQAYFGIVAREGALNTGSEGYLVWFEVKDQLEAWLAD